MADMDAEMAFLNSMKEADPAADYAPADAEDDGDESEYDPAHIDASYAAHDGHSLSDLSASMPESAAQTPSGFEDAPLRQPPADIAAAPTATTKQPRTVGGFVVESDEEDSDAVSQAVGSSTVQNNETGGITSHTSHTPQVSISSTNTLPASNVSLHSVQDQGLSGVSSSSAGPTVNITVPHVASVIPAAGTPVSDAASKSGGQDANASASTSARPSAVPTPVTTASLPKPRLPQDRLGILEDRIADDPRGDMDAWLSLISEHRKRGKFAEARQVYERFFKVFPTAAEDWVHYARMEQDLEQFALMEQIFAKSIVNNPHIELLSTYLDYVRRRQNLTTDATGDARKVVTQAYEFVLQTVGIDINSGKLWRDYIEFIKSGPGVVGGNTWQDMQKMDTLRKVYQRAVAIPMNATSDIWREYDRFEMGLNRTTGRKYLQDKSPSFVTARSANNYLENLTRGIVRTTRPKLPPAPGFDGYDDFMEQVELWKKWIEWEKSDPLYLKEDDATLQKSRVVYLYKQALMALYFWHELWYEAADYCFKNDLTKEGTEFLTQGVAANPESCLLAFKHADRIELTGEFEDSEVGVFRKGQAVREPYDKVLEALYDLVKKTNQRAERAVAAVKEAHAKQQAQAEEEEEEDDYVGMEEEQAAEKARLQKEREEALEKQIQAIKAGFDAQVLTLKKTISYAWIALMRAMRRIQGKGVPYPTGTTPPGFRGIFIEARQKGFLLSEAYIASALIEHNCYQDTAALKIFERGMKLFPEDETFALAYIQHLISQNDATNARSVFETVVNRLTQKPENIPRTKTLFSYFHEYESRYGELAQITKLEKRMADLFPDDPEPQRFARRFANPIFDPTSVRPIISQLTQMRPKLPPLPPQPAQQIMPTIEESIPPPMPAQPPAQDRFSPPPAIKSPKPAPMPTFVTNSPKRPFDESDNEAAQPRKLMRGESPLKGAAGRRLADAQRRNIGGGSSNLNPAAPPAPLPRDINILLSILPPAHTYTQTRFHPDRMVALLRTVNLPGQPGQPQPPQPATPIVAPPPAGAWPPPMGGMPQYGGYPANNPYYR